MRKSIQSLLALSVTLAFSGSAFAATETITNTEVNPVVISEKQPTTDTKDSVQTDAPVKDTAKVEKKKQPTFVITKGSAYQQLSYDVRQHGYRLQWQLRNDAPLQIKSDKFTTWQDKTLDIVAQLNKFFVTGNDDGSMIKAFICPQFSYVVIAPERSAGMVVDKDGRGCNLLSKAPEEKDEQAQSPAGLQAVVSNAVAVPSVAYETYTPPVDSQPVDHDLPTVTFER